jgi:crossover junction endodeoxyribonuclease RuvC
VFSIGELGGVIKLLLYDNSILFGLVQPTVLKKFVTGKGNSKKELMLLNVYKKFGFDTDNNNIADAYALGRFALKDADENWTRLMGLVDSNKVKTV